MQLLKPQISLLFRATRCGIFRQLHILDLIWISYVTRQKDIVKCTVKINTHMSAQSFGDFAQLVECWFTNNMIARSRLIAVTSISDFAPVWNNQLLNIQRTTYFGFNLKIVGDMTTTYSPMHCKDKYSHLSSIIFWLWSIGWLFVYEEYDYGFGTNCSYLTLRFRFCFEQQVPQHSDNHRLCI